MIHITINGRTCHAREGERVLSVARREGIEIPSLCYEESLEPYGACRLCFVEVLKGSRPGIVTSCTLEAVEGLEVLTETPEITRMRKVLLELYLAQAPKAEAIRALAERYGVTKTRFPKRIVREDPLQNRCILCGLCVRVCRDVMGAGAISYIGRGQFTEINTPFHEENEVCMGCGACAEICPTQAIALEDGEQNRVLRSWSETRVPLKRCEGCGRYFAPVPFARYAHEKLDPPLKATVQVLCPECRRKEATRRFLDWTVGKPTIP